MRLYVLMDYVCGGLCPEGLCPEGLCPERLCP